MFGRLSEREGARNDIVIVRVRMAYDWTGKKSRRIQTAKISLILMVLAFVLTAPIISPHV
jgi:hypothetical protein